MKVNADMNCPSAYRTISSLRNESEAILPGHILSYQHGQLPTVGRIFQNIVKESIPLDCSLADVYNHISKRSSCPWRFELNVDENRIPREIFEAKCRTRHCSGSVIGGCELQRCEEIKHFTFVKRRVSESTFKSILEPIAVGCTCACKKWKNTRRRLNRVTMCQ